MRREELTAALAGDKIKKVCEGDCPVCGAHFRTSHKHGRMTCGEARCRIMLRRCVNAVIQGRETAREKTRAGAHYFTAQRAMLEARKAGDACATMLDPWLANYGTGITRTADPAWGF